MNTERVILVDENDLELGTEEKLKAHREALLHRAFSVFIFNSAGELLLQQRAREKYHSPGLWTNTCCSHPRPGENTLAAAHRRLQEEIGLNCELKQVFSFIYKAELDQGLTEHEFDHVLFGLSDAKPALNQVDVQDYQYIAASEVDHLLEKTPEQFTEWFKICWPTVKTHFSV